MDLRSLAHDLLVAPDQDPLDELDHLQTNDQRNRYEIRENQQPVAEFNE